MSRLWHRRWLVLLGLPRRLRLGLGGRGYLRRSVGVLLGWVTWVMGRGEGLEGKNLHEQPWHPPWQPVPDSRPNSSPPVHSGSWRRPCWLRYWPRYWRHCYSPLRQRHLRCWRRRQRLGLRSVWLGLHPGMPGPWPGSLFLRFGGRSLLRRGRRRGIGLFGRAVAGLAAGSWIVVGRIGRLVVRPGILGGMLGRWIGFAPRAGLFGRHFGACRGIVLGAVLFVLGRRRLVTVLLLFGRVVVVVVVLVVSLSR